MLYIFLAILVVHIVNGQECLRANNINGAPQFQDYHTTIFNTGIIGNQHQTIIASYRFDCCGNITKWGVDVSPERRRDDMMYTLDLQVWRPSPTVKITGCYSLVGNNRFTSVSLNNSVAVVTPLPQDRIRFQPGDVIGFYVENDDGADRGVVVIDDFAMQGDEQYKTEEVWHADTSRVVISDLDCPYPVGSPIPGSLRVLTDSTNAAAVISVAYSATACPQILPTRSTTTSPSFSMSIISRATALPYSTPPVKSHGSPTANIAIIGILLVGTLVVVIITLVLAAVCLWMKRNHKVMGYTRPQDRSVASTSSKVNTATELATITESNQNSEKGDNIELQRQATVSHQNEAYGIVLRVQRQNTVSQQNEAYGISTFNDMTFSQEYHEYEYVQFQT